MTNYTPRRPPKKSKTEAASPETPLTTDTDVESKESPSPDPNLITWTSPTDPANPTNWSFTYRWTLITLVSSITFISGLSSSMFAPGVPALMREFHSTNSALASFVVTVFVLGLAAGPLVFAPLSELYGRLPIQHFGHVGFLAFTIGCATARSLSTFIVMRLFQGCFAAVPLTIGGGIIADMVKQEERGFAFAMFTLGVLLAPVVGPVTGGFLAAAMGWQWVFWVLSMALAFLLLLSLILWRETYAPVLLARKASLLRKQTGNQNLHTAYTSIAISPRAHFQHSITRVVKILLYSPIVLALSIQMGLVYAYFYLFFTTFTPIFEDVYHFTPSSAGLSYIGVGVGLILGQVVFAACSDRILKAMTARRSRISKGAETSMMPEYRLPPCMIGGLFTPIALFWYGWSVQAKIHWIMPIIGAGFLGFGNSLIFMGIQTYLVDAFTIFAASALAGNMMVRSVMASVLPLAAPQMYARLGYGWGNSLLAFLALAMIPVPALLMIYGERMRKWNAEKIRNL